MIENVMHVVIHVFKHALVESVGLIPFLFLTYLLLEYIENKMSKKSKKAIEKAGKFGPVIGGLVGAVPQCGFSVSATNLYASRVITLGTLIAVYLSTSDEMIPVMLSESAVSKKLIIELVLIKVVIGIIAGLIIDLVLTKVFKVHEEEKIEEICKQEHCHCEDGIFKSALKHTVKIFFYIFATAIIFNGLIEIVGHENIEKLLLNKKILGPAIAGLIGLIPNCAASVIITQMYVKGLISVGALLAGLLVGAGVGLIVLFKMNKNIKQNIRIVSLLYLIGTVCGIIFELIGIVL